ncbi:CHAT domain-containing protein [Algoriphagus taiwanensis]|uniref:CHAT domain-containing protein n=1 Tax=Algoriphagus taiwanensis TaxID=1445656 RepID=UPI0030C6F456
MPSKKALGLLFLFLGSFSCLQAQTFREKLEQADQLYFLDAPTEEQDRKALELYEEVLSFTPEPEESMDFVLACERAGNLYLTFRMPEKAKFWYAKGIELARAFGHSDTLVYAHHLYLGESYFGLNQFDSSLYHLETAERIQSKIDQGMQPERLYNALGVYFFETGNFNRSISYFTKANSYLDAEDPNQLYARYSFLSNKASALYRLGRFDEAQAIYSDLLNFGINKDQILLNLANTYLEQNQGQEALQVLGQVNTGFGNRSLSYLNLKAKAWMQVNRLDSLEQTLETAEKLISDEFANRKILQKAIFYTNSGDLALLRGNEKTALDLYQRSIEQLLPTYSSSGFMENPKEYPFGISFLSLFEVLTKKAEASWKLYQRDKSKQWFDLGIDTWEAAFRLSSFISANYDNDEARIFLGDRVLEGYKTYLNGLFFLSSSQDREMTMKRIFSLSERSKAEALKIGRNQEAKKRQSQIPKSLIQEERNILYAISRTYQQQLNASSEDQIQDVEAELADLQVRLSRLREDFRKIDGFTEQKNREIDLEAIQEKLGEDLTLMTFFLSEAHLFVFVISEDSFESKAIALDRVPFDGLEAWLRGIRNPGSSSRWGTPEEIKAFSELVFGNFQRTLKRGDELLIVPHDILNSVPFELMPFEGEKLLLEVLPVTYQYSSWAILEASKAKKQSGFLAFAPFLGEEVETNSSGFARLPMSFAEVEDRKGQVLIGKDASREAFLSRAHQAGILHLATHAVASSEDPNEAFIAFYPEEEEFRVFAPELAFQNLQNTQLVYLSACETGSGVLSKSEGIISLARSLSIAGVDQLVFSQWISEDKVAAFIAQRFYRYLDKGESYSNSLRLARLDLISDPKMAQFHHPFYWANFRVVGLPDSSSDEEWALWQIALVISFGLMLLLVGVLVMVRK